MRSPQPWKIKREVLRLFRDLTNFPPFLLKYLLATPYYDHYLSRRRKTWSGQAALSDRVVIYVIYPEQGILESHLTALRHFQESGYAAVVVSNLPLSQMDRDAVLANSARYIERPNYGYDFGAYRDGILSLSNRLNSLKRLAIMNDSAWFPLPERRNWLREAETMGHDLVGAVSNYGTPRVDARNYLDLEWSYSYAHPNFHYASFALSFCEKISGDPSFLKFWKRLRMEKNKRRVVRRGEIGISQWVISRGYSHACMFDPTNLPNMLASLSDERLGQLARNTILPEDYRLIALKTDLISLPQSAPDWRRKVTQFILCSTSKQGASYVLPDLTIKEMGFPFLKKSPLRLSQDGADATMQVLDELQLGDANAIVREARDIYDSRSSQLQHRAENAK